MSLIDLRLLRDVNNSETVSVNSASFSYYTKSIPLQNGSDFGIAYKSDIAQPSVTLIWEQSPKLPDNECEEDGWFVTPEGMSNIATNVNTSTAHITSVSPVAMPYGRVKLTSAAATTSAVFTLYFGIVENV